jgi:hypothetical protein
MTQPALVIGHYRDPIHPFSDSDMLARELPNARLLEASSILGCGSRRSGQERDRELRGGLLQAREPARQRRRGAATGGRRSAQARRPS